jgi:hypothetical protein
MTSASPCHLPATPLWRRGAAGLTLMLLGAAGYACSANSVTVVSPQALRDGVGAGGRGAIVVGVGAPAMRTQSRAPVAETAITFWKIELIRDQGSAPASLYGNATLTAGSHIMQTAYLDGPAAGTAGGAMADLGNARQLAFTNVPAGSYRVRVMAYTDANTPGTQARNDGDTYFAANSGWEISENKATVTNGSSLVSYSAPDGTKLTVHVHLHDGLGDTINTAVAVANGRPASDAGLAPNDPGSASVMHDFSVTVSAVTSTFVWIPRYTAYQLINPTAYGTTNRFGTQDNARPAGFWVATPPNAGTPATDYQVGQFGGFYAGKCEASRADATTTTAGSSTTLSVRQDVVPWDFISWEDAATACTAYHPKCSLMGDDEWTALAVRSMIDGLTVKGNNSNLADHLGGVTFTSDPTHGSGRARTGTGGVTTSHTGTAAGVYDLNGNLYEWTNSLSSKTGISNWIVDGIESTVTVPVTAGFVTSLATGALVRAQGLPATYAPSTPNASFNGDRCYFPAAVGNQKPVRGGAWTDGSEAGLWCMDLYNGRTATAPSIGFRPVLRY